MHRSVMSSGSAGTLAVLIALSAGSAAAQDAVTAGEGPQRICNPVIDSASNPVAASQATVGVVIHGSTYDCPEEVAMVEPAAPPPPLPEQGLVYFAFDKADLSEEASATLEDIIADIKDRQLGGITVAGFTDTAGPAEYNMVLSERRADTVAGTLIDAGIPADIVTTEAFGETHLAVETPNNTPKQANRRATIDFSQ
jgi:outer membrane protein OmpA-like peptidoglycan-associated protein